MRCQYCHNVDTWNPETDNLQTADELLDKAERFRSYWGTKGGITVSGGEALLQIDFLIELFRKAHERGINTTLDTCGQPFTREEPFFSKFNELIKYTDLVMLDIKHIDDEEHKKLTGHTNKNILDCARLIRWIRSRKWRFCHIIHLVLISGKNLAFHISSKAWIRQRRIALQTPRRSWSFRRSKLRNINRQ